MLMALRFEPRRFFLKGKVYVIQRINVKITWCKSDDDFIFP